MKIEEIMQERFSCRNFKDEKLKNEIVSDILDSTRLSPSSVGLEPWEFVVVSKKDDLKKLGQICFDQSHVTNCSHAVVIFARVDLQGKDKYLKEVIYSKNKGEEKAKRYFEFIASKTDLMSKDELFNYALLQCYIALANLVNIAYSKGVDSCIIGGFDREALAKFIALPSQFIPCVVVALGVGESRGGQKSRRTLEDVAIWF